ncbi:MAG TPA: winged helix-turn-helix domain-containing protein [Pyrinomonadaceae bacterium]|nr:winged helix-turn-helix domain-containing protein [Pyrinomonadaceae bacterium]
MSLEINSFEFEEFILDNKEKTLLRNGQPIPITPKAFQLLLFLLENHGRLVKKEELMQAVWTENFVEEGNLTFTIRLLRKALEDSRQNPRFIKTVPLHGYKFIAEVRKISAESKENFVTDEVVKVTKEKFSVSRFKRKTNALIVLISIFLICAVVFGGLYLQNRSAAANLPIFQSNFAAEKLSTNGKVAHAVISPDGKTVVYTNGINGKQSVWRREIESGSNVEIVSASDEIYGGLAFSPDGNFVYFNRNSRTNDAQGAIFRVSFFGGIPEKIVDQTQGWHSISPDGTKISFVRCFYSAEEFCSLWIADSKNGKNERKLAAFPRPIRIGDNRFSPDGKTIAFAVGQSQNQANEFGLMEFNLENGEQRELSTEKFFDIKRLVWLPGKSGWLVTASRTKGRNFRIWRVGEKDSIPLTNDSESYASLSLDNDFKSLVSTQFKPDFRLEYINIENPLQRKVSAEAESASFSTDGKIVYSSDKSGNLEIWASELNGNRQTQLTNSSAEEVRPIVSHDNNFIFFASNRTGETQVWRMNADGSDQKQITQNEGGFPLFVSPDGSRIFYHHGRLRTIWSASTYGGDEKLILDKRKYDFGFSPDGLRVVFAENFENGRTLAVYSFTEQKIVKTFKIPDENSRILEIEWMPDGKNVVYVLSGKSEKLGVWRQNLNEEKPQKIADFDDEEISEALGLAVSPDGKGLLISRGGWRHDAVLLKGLK